MSLKPGFGLSFWQVPKTVVAKCISSHTSLPCPVQVPHAMAPWKLFCVLMACVAQCDAAAAAAECTALEAARQLVAPKVHLKRNGEFEGGDFWEKHEELLKRAWKERSPLHAGLYEYGPAFEKEYIHPALRDAVQQAQKGREKEAQALFQEVIPGVELRVFVSDFHFFNEHPSFFCK